MISNLSSSSGEMEWPSYLNEYEKLVMRMNTPRVVIDNGSCEAATLVKVDSARDHACLLETVQVLTDLDLLISKAYISSDGPYFMDVFHVTDRLGLKLSDLSLLSFIQLSIQSGRPPSSCGGGGLAALEIAGVDHPGLLSEIFAVMSDLKCAVAEARVWTHNGRIASVIFVDGEDVAKIRRVEARLGHVVQGTVVLSSGAGIHVDRRLHQMMSADRHYEKSDGVEVSVSVSVQSSIERGYSIVNVACGDRPKLLFDMVCALTDMDYVVFHGNIDTDGDRANQEFYIRHTDGTPIGSEAERHRVVQRLQAAIERRSYCGLKLELCTSGDQRALAEVTRAFRENGLLVTRAEVDTATNVFYVTDAGGNSPDLGVVESVRQRIGSDCLRVIEERVRGSWASRETEEGDGNVSNRGGVGLFNIGSLVLRNLYNLGLIRSCS